MSTSPKNQKLELTWIGKGEEPKLEPRILIENPEYSYGDPNSENMLIHGDNLLALKALEQDYAGKVKCIYIDPPFNTGEAFEHYDDGVEHSTWLNLMRNRIVILHRLLGESGTLVIHIDDNELGYLMALTDEIFGRNQRINIITFKQSSVSGPKSINPGLVSTANYILIYAKNKSQWTPNKIYQKTNRDDRYSKFIANKKSHHSEWILLPLKQAFASIKNVSIDELKLKFGDKLESNLEKFVLEHAESVVRTARVADKDVNEEAREELQKSRENPAVVQLSEREGKSDYYFLGGEQLIFYSSKTQFIDGTLSTAIAASNIWDDLLSNNLHKEGEVSFKKGKKPEALIKRILDFTTQEDDWVLDSFLGSGTTASVAHKMGRKWIGVELGDHAITHCVPRIKQVIDGEQGGISKAVGWKGGGGFKFYTLAPSLLNQDRFGQWVINKEYNPDMLAAAMAKQEGFRYAPDEQVYWKQGRSTEKDFIFTTTRFLTVESLDKIQEEMRDEESLLICSKAFQQECENKHPNITIRKIPSLLLGKCEFGKDDYSLNIINLPEELRPIPEESDHFENLNQEESDASEKSLPSPSSTNQQSLF